MYVVRFYIGFACYVVLTEDVNKAVTILGDCIKASVSGEIWGNGRLIATA